MTRVTLQAIGKGTGKGTSKNGTARNAWWRPCDHRADIKNDRAQEQKVLALKNKRRGDHEVNAARSSCA